MKKHLLCLGALLLVAGAAYYLGSHKKHNCEIITPKRCALRTAMRKLWSDHVWWTRDYLITAIADMPDLAVTTNRLLKNQDDIGNAIVPYYGKEAGAKLGALLRDHIMLAANAVTAAKANDTAKLKEADKKWHDNADAIAEFLSNANPNFKKDAIQSMMYEHLKVTTEEALARIKKDWKADIAAFEKVFDEIMMLADGLTDGIVKQFPDKF